MAGGAMTPPSTRISVAASPSGVRVRSKKCETDAMEGRASPRKPRVVIAARSSARRILLVAWRAKASRASSAVIPSPSSSTRMDALPPSSTATFTRRAPASSAFSTSSLTTDAGRSTTSPAAIWFASSAGSWTTLPISRARPGYFPPSWMAACAAARRATGTRNGEQLT